MRKAWGLVTSHWVLETNILAGLVAASVLVIGLMKIVGPALTTTLPGPTTTTVTTKTMSEGSKVTAEVSTAKSDPTKTTTEGPRLTTEASTGTATGATGLIERFIVASHLTLLKRRQP